MKTLVTGGAGFVGSHLVRTLVDQGDDVVVLDSLRAAGPRRCRARSARLGRADRRRRRRRAAGRPGARGRRPRRAPRRRRRRRPVDVRDRPLHRAQHDGDRALPRARRRRAAAAGAHGRRLLDVDLRRGRVPLQRARLAGAGPAARGAAARTHVGAGDAPTAAATLEPVATSEAKPLIPTSIYAINKRDHEEMCLVVGAAYGIPTVALRFFNVYGPGQALSNPYTGVAAIFASRLLNGRSPVVFEDGRQSRDFIHVSDIVRGILLALESDAAAGNAHQPRHRPHHHRRRRRRGPRPTAWASTSRPSATASTAPATSATASPTPPARASCWASRPA